MNVPVILNIYNDIPFSDAGRIRAVCHCKELMNEEELKKEILGEGRLHVFTKVFSRRRESWTQETVCGVNFLLKTTVAERDFLFRKKSRGEKQYF